METLNLNVSMLEAGQAIAQAAKQGIDLRVKIGADRRAYLVKAGQEGAIYEQ